MPKILISTVKKIAGFLDTKKLVIADTSKLKTGISITHFRLPTVTNSSSLSTVSDNGINSSAMAPIVPRLLDLRVSDPDSCLRGEKLTQERGGHRKGDLRELLGTWLPETEGHLDGHDNMHGCPWGHGSLSSLLGLDGLDEDECRPPPPRADVFAS